MLLVVAVVAALVYAVVRMVERRRAAGGPGPRSRPRTVAPDDDEDFLRSLEHEREPDEDDPAADPAWRPG